MKTTETDPKWEVTTEDERTLTLNFNGKGICQLVLSLGLSAKEREKVLRVYRNAFLMYDTIESLPLLMQMPDNDFAIRYLENVRKSVAI